MARAFQTSWLALGFLSACVTPVSVDGEAGGREFERFTTGFFDTYDELNGIRILYFADYKWSCEEIQTSAAQGIDWPMEDNERVVAMISFYPFTVTDDWVYQGATSATSYQILEATDLADIVDLERGKPYATGAVSYGNLADTVSQQLYTESGTLTITTLELDDHVEGSFSINLDDGSHLDGEFDLEPCLTSDF